MQSAGDKISGIGGKMKPATVAIAGIGTAAVKTYASFESKMSNVQAISGATGDDLIKLSDKAKEMVQRRSFQLLNLRMRCPIWLWRDGKQMICLMVWKVS